MLLPPISNYFMYPLIWGKIMHNGLTISSFWQPIKCLKGFLLRLNLLNTTIWSIVTENKSIDSLYLWNSFLLSIILLHCNVFSFIFYIKEKTKSYLFLMLLFYIQPILNIFFLIQLIFIFLFLWQVFIMLSWLLFYSFFLWFIILSSFFFRIIFFCFPQDFLPIKPVIVHFYILVWQL